MAQCTAHRKNGDRCKAPAIKGGTVCRVHGGAAPQVRDAARLRLLALVDPALATLGRSLDLKGNQAQVALAAARDVLDRAGFKSTEKLEISGADGGPIREEMVVRFVRPGEAVLEDEGDAG